VTSFPSSSIGKNFRFRIFVKTTQPQLETYSEIGYAILAGVPAKPSDKPVNDLTVTTDSRIRVTYASPVPNNSGTPLLSYELLMDDGISGVFTSLTGFASNSMNTFFTVEGKGLVIKGRQHRFKYRAKNLVGWGPYSDPSSVLAAIHPSKPPRPTFSSYTTNSLKIVIPLSVNNGGSTISLYEVYVDAGNNFNSAFTKLSPDYTGTTTTYTVTGLTVGSTYRFKTRSKNIINFSEYSEDAYIAFGNVPNTPLAPTRTKSIETAITVAWLEPSASDLKITGYILNIDDGNNMDLKPVYIGTNRPDIRSFSAGGLKTGLPYRFSV
jgi:hypothetical protein